MNAKIVDFNKAKMKHSRTNKRVSSFILNKQVNNAKKAYSEDLQQSTNKEKYISNFETEYKKLMESLHTKKCKFKFPTVLSGYKKGMNPVDALYQNVQAALFNAEDNDFYSWILGIFNDQQWVDELVLALQIDCKKLESFHKTHHKNIHKHGSEKVDNVKHCMDKFKHYQVIFKNVSESSKTQK